MINVSLTSIDKHLTLKKPNKSISTTICQLLCIFSVIFYSGCSTFISQEQSVDKRYEITIIEPQLRALENWSLFGKLGIRTYNDSVTAAINNWKQTGEQFEIDISSTFFGLGSSKLYGNPNFLSIFQSGEEPLSSFEPDHLIQTALGFPLPISHLQYWIKGLPVKDIPYSRTFNQQGLVSSLEQDNWSLSYSNYHTEHSVPLPGKIKIQQDDIRIIVAVKEWTLP